MYSYEDRIRAVKLYIKLGQRVAATIRQLGYLDVLESHNLDDIFSGSPDLSGLFLSDVPTHFADATHRMMVVGMETKAWRNNECPFKLDKTSTLQHVIESMEVQKRFLEGSAGRHRFLQFLNQVRKSADARLSREGVSIVWSNLFCVSHSGKSPTKAHILAP